MHIYFANSICSQLFTPFIQTADENYIVCPIKIMLLGKKETEET